MQEHEERGHLSDVPAAAAEDRQQHCLLLLLLLQEEEDSRCSAVVCQKPGPWLLGC
jgi:hypothetical protein